MGEDYFERHWIPLRICKYGVRITHFPVKMRTASVHKIHKIDYNRETQRLVDDG